MTSEALTPEQRLEIEQTMRVFQSEGQEFVKKYPDYSETLAAAAERGLDMDIAATREIVKTGKRGVALAHYLAKRENLDATTKLMNLKGEKAAEEVRRLLGWIDRIGYAVEYEPRVSEEDTYLQKRRHELRYGYRRR